MGKKEHLWEITHLGQLYKADYVINCGGLWGDDVESLRLQKVPFKIKPKKGQFIVYGKIDDDNVPDCIIEPVYDEIKKTKGVIIWKTIYGNVIVGPTAEMVTSKDDRSK